MSNNLSSEELVRRYIAQVARRLPRKQREDVARELDSLLRETLEERERERSEPLNPQATAAVLKEFGSPDEISKQYSPRPNYLIGPRMYPVLILTLKAVLGGTFGLAALVTGIRTMAGDIVNPLEAALGFLGLYCQLAYSLSVAAVVVFAILERFGPEEIRQFEGDEWDPFEMPEVSASSEISAVERYVKIYGTIVAMLWLNFFPQWVGVLFIPGEAGVRFVTLTEMGIMLPMLVINLWWIAEIAFNVVLLRQGRWTRATRWVEVALGASAAGIFGLIFRRVTDAVASGTFAAAIPYPGLTEVFAKMLPLACVLAMAGIFVGTAVRLFRLLRPAGGQPAAGSPAGLP